MCKYCDNGALMHNFYPQIAFDKDSEKPFSIYYVAKILIEYDEQLYWAQVEPKNLKSFENAECELLAIARYCPVCGAYIGGDAQ